MFDEIQIEDTYEFDIAEERMAFEEHMRKSAIWTDEEMDRFNADHPE